MEKIRFIYFDLGNVLLKFSVRRLLHQIAEVSGVSDDEVRQAFFDDQWYLKYEKGEIDGIEYFAHYCQQINNSVPSEDLINAANDIFWVNEPILPLLRHLAGEFFPRGILSNTGPHHWAYIQEAFSNIIGLIPRHRIASFEVGAIKPYPEIYRIALDEARKEVSGLEPAQVLLIDDLEENVAGAKKFGFQAVCYGDHNQLLGELKRLGVPLPAENA